MKTMTSYQTCCKSSEQNPDNRFFSQVKRAISLENCCEKLYLKIFSFVLSQNVQKQLFSDALQNMCS